LERRAYITGEFFENRNEDVSALLGGDSLRDCNEALGTRLAYAPYLVVNHLGEQREHVSGDDLVGCPLGDVAKPASHRLMVVTSSKASRLGRMIICCHSTQEEGKD